MSRSILTRALVAASAALVAVPTFAHHSFAMYDHTKMLVLTGVVYQFVAQANHAELHMYLIGADGKLEKNADGKPHAYGIEMAGAAAVAEQGITAETMKPGTIISVKVNPLRVGQMSLEDAAGPRQGLRLRRGPRNSGRRQFLIALPAEVACLE